MYEFLFKFVTGKTYEGVREHFMSLAKQAEMDLVIMQIMCIFHNRKNNERFRDMIYCVSPQFMYHMLQKYHHKYFDLETGRPYELSTLKDNDGLEYIIKDKMKKAHYVVVRSRCQEKKLYVLNSLNPKTTGSSERINRFASNILDQMIVYAGGETMFPGPITTQMASHSLLPKYIRVPKQPNQFDCGVYILKYLEMVNPTELGKKTYKIPPWSERRDCQYILLHNDKAHRSKAVQASEPKQRASRPSRALQSPYMQLNSSDLESGNAKHKKK
ncbi:hypothetical protein PIB30_042903 [Stylosanthes scabra]|uniref:Ubiquitin-like protease family profile domain-containing protein n=1 Tax=Stylosanthes scabra TaxID=79078 RepID=A0ABU6TGA6_9FABA|nr:hypothetical protein [Stylosanthes scabra]